MELPSPLIFPMVKLLYAEKNHSFRRPARPHEIRTRLKLTAMRSSHKNTCFHRWKNKKAGIFMWFSVASLDMGTCIPITSGSSAPCHQGTLHYLAITKTRREKNNVIASKAGSGHHLKNHHRIIRSGDRTKAASKCDKLSHSKALRNSSETSLVIQVHFREWIN